MTSSTQSKKVSLSDAISWSLKLYSDNFFPLLKLALLGAIPSVIYQLAVEVQPGANGGLWVLSLIAILTGLVFFTAMIRSIACIHGGRTSILTELVGEGFKRFWSFLGALILVGLAQILASLGIVFCSMVFEHTTLVIIVLLTFAVLCALIMALVYISTVSVFFPFALVLNDEGPVAALRRSFNIVHKSFWPVLGAIMLLFVIAAAVSLPIMIGLRMLGTHLAIMTATMAGIGIVLTPFMIAYMFRLFITLEQDATTVGISIYDKAPSA